MPKYLDRPSADIDKLLNLNPNAVVDYIHRLEEERDRLLAVAEAVEYIVQVHDYRLLDRGIGTETTSGKVWLQIRSTLSQLKEAE